MVVEHEKYALKEINIIVPSHGFDWVNNYAVIELDYESCTE